MHTQTYRWPLMWLLLFSTMFARADNDLEDLERFLEDPDMAAAVHQIGRVPLSSNVLGYDPCDDPRADKASRTGCEANGKIEHILYITLENHTFDNYFGNINEGKVRVPGADVSAAHNDVPQRLTDDENRDYRFPTERFHLTEYCGWSDLGHSWDAIHRQTNYNRMDGFLVSSGTNSPVMGQFKYKDLAFYYDIAERFSIADRVFTSAASQSWPNHYYLVSGTSGGFINNDLPVVQDNPQERLAPGITSDGTIKQPQSGHTWRTIFESLEDSGVSWRIYMTNIAIPMAFNNFKKWVASGHVTTIAQYHKDVAAGKLPQVAYLAPGVNYSDEHPGSGNHQRGQATVAALIKSLMTSPSWASSAFFITYDDSGGWYDHVPPPRGYQPNDNCDESPLANAENCVNGTWVPGTKEGYAPPREERYGDTFDQLGARIPFTIVSPWVKKPEHGLGYASHNVYENATVLSFIEWRFGLNSLNDRTRAYKDGWRNPGCDWDVRELKKAAASRGASDEIRALAWSADLYDPFRFERCEACPADDPFCLKGDGGNRQDIGRVGAPDGLGAKDGRAVALNPKSGNLEPVKLAFKENRYLDPLLDPFDFQQKKPALLDGAAIAAQLSPHSETDLEELAICPVGQQRMTPSDDF